MKPDPLSEAERRIVSMHAEQGARLLSALGAAEATAQAVGQHHERYDGAGYPRRLCRDEIRVEARIIALCDAWATMRVERGDQVALPVEEALEELRSGRNRQFDPDLAELFIDLVQRGIVGELGQLVAPLPFRQFLGAY